MISMTSPFQIKEDLWASIIGLFIDCCREKKMVSVSIFEKISPKGKQFLVAVPQQKVTDYMTSFLNEEIYCNLLSGEKLTMEADDGWHFVGAVLNHGTMSPFFSGVTDAHELQTPGTYLCVGNIDIKNQTYKTMASVVINGQRHQIMAEDVVPAVSAGQYHPNVMNYILKH